MKKLLIITIAILLLNNLSAQIHQLKFELGPSVVFPTGILNTISSTGIGLDGTFLYQLSNKYTIFGYTGFDLFGGKSYSDLSIKSTFHVPLIAGMRYTRYGFFAGLGIGTGTYDFGRSGYSETHFAFSPQIGYSFQKFEFTSKYNYTVMNRMNLAYFSFTAAYKF
jgi:hypothetical protein